MADLSPALRTDLDFAVSQYGLAVEDLPRDHEGKSLEERLCTLVETGEAWCGSPFRRHDLRSVDADVWQLFPENPVTAREQSALIEEVGDLLHRDEQFRRSPAPSLVKFSDLPRAEHVGALDGLLRFIDGTGPAPDVDEAAWTDLGLFEQAAELVPALREAERAVRTRAELIQDLSTGKLPQATARFVRDALGSEACGLRNADLILAGYQVKAQNLRDAVQLEAERLRPHFQLAERIRQVRDDLNRIDEALHWPGPWQDAPARQRQNVVAAA